MRIVCEQTAAVAIDYQEKLIPVMYEKEKLMENSKILLAGLRELGVPVTVTQQYTKGLGMTDSSLRKMIGTEQYKEKLSFSAIEEIREEVQSKKFIILCGIEAHICVLQTLIDLKAEGFIPVLVEDCISSRTAHNKEIAIERAKQEGAIITTYEALLFELLKKAGTETSKKIQRLVK